nr:hypothetical protein [Candidatus Sigynarchaeota archaeon]
MTDRERHLEKYRMFKRDAENPSVSPPTRVEAYFSAAFHLIEACVAGKGLHVDKHQRVRAVLEAHADVFGGNTDRVWRAFQRIENQIRPGQLYEGKINGEAVEDTEKNFREIEEICLKLLRG